MGQLITAGARVTAVWDATSNARDQQRRQWFLEMAWHEAQQTVRDVGRMDALVGVLTTTLTAGGPAAAWAAARLSEIAERAS